MKRLLLFLVILLFAASAMAQVSFDPGIGYGRICQAGANPVCGYLAYGKFENIPIFPGDAEISYLQSSKNDEIQVIRALGLTDYDFYKNSTWRIYMEFGAGLWHFINTPGNDKDYSCYVAGFGVSWNRFNLRIQHDNVNMDDADILFTSVNLKVEI